MRDPETLGNKTSLVPTDLVVVVGAPALVLNITCGTVNVSVKEGFAKGALSANALSDSVLV